MPQRFLRPGIRTSERWNAVSRNAQALYLAILTLVDDYGRYDARVSILHADAFAVWNELNPTIAVNPQETAALRSELQSKNLMDVYEFEGRQFLQLTQWQERTRGKSKYPDPSAGIRSIPQESAAKSCLLSHRHKPSPEPESDSRATRPTLEMIQLQCAKIGLPESEAEKFLAYYESNGWKVGKNPMKSWQSALIHWRSNWQERKGNGHTPKSNGSDTPQEAAQRKRNFGGMTDKEMIAESMK